MWHFSELMSLLRVVVVGAGSIGREFALRHLVKDLGVEVVAIVDRQLELAQSLAHDVGLARAGAIVEGSKYRETVNAESAAKIPACSIPIVRTAINLEDVLDDVDICYIGTPPSTHSALTLMSLRAKKHVLLEKPIAVSDSDTEAIVAEAEQAWLESKLVVNVNIGMRFSEAALETKRLISNGHIGQLQRLKLRLLFLQWPRAWQTQPWCAGRAQGGPLLEVGTHWIFGLLEIIGHDKKLVGNTCKIEYPDGPEGTLCESKCTGVLEFEGGLTVEVHVEGASEEAQKTGKDIYELITEGDNGKSLVLYDFSKLRDGVTGEDLKCGSYGRQECVIELVKAIRSQDRSSANLVTPQQAQNVQRLIQQMKNGQVN